MDSSGVEFKKNMIIFIMGATGTGKSRLSIDLASRFPAELINSDKMQVYKHLEIVTNKVSEGERLSVPHHLLGWVEKPDIDYNAFHFSFQAVEAIDKVISSGRVPIVVGGSNSFIQTLVEDPVIDLKSRYDCCFICVDVTLKYLFSYVSKRVDQMVDAGLVEEVRGIFDPKADYNKGVRRAIGVPELDKYFRAESEVADEKAREILLKAAIQEIKDNTHALICSQLEKIKNLQEKHGWEITRIDATPVFDVSNTPKQVEIAWEEGVLKPAMHKVAEFFAKHGDVIQAQHVRKIITN